MPQDNPTAHRYPDLVDEWTIRSPVYLYVVSIATHESPEHPRSQNSPETPLTGNPGACLPYLSRASRTATPAPAASSTQPQAGTLRQLPNKPTPKQPQRLCLYIVSPHLYL